MVTRPWYKKKRYIVPLGLVGALFIGSAMSDTSTTTAPVSSYTPTVQQVNTAPLEKVTPQPTSAATVKRVTPAASSDTPLSNDNYYTNSAGNTVHSPAYAPSRPAGASAQCRDGTYSFSQSRRGTCSHHGGVAQWF